MPKMTIEQIKTNGQTIFDWKRKGLTTALMEAKNKLDDAFMAIDSGKLFDYGDSAIPRQQARGRILGEFLEKHIAIIELRDETGASIKESVDAVIGTGFDDITPAQQEHFDDKALSMRITAKTANNVNQLLDAANAVLDVAEGTPALVRKFDVEAFIDGYERLAGKVTEDDAGGNHAVYKRILDRFQQGRHSEAQKEALAVLDDAAFFNKIVYKDKLHEDALKSQLNVSGEAAKFMLEFPQAYAVYLDALKDAKFVGFTIARAGNKISDGDILVNPQLQEMERIRLVGRGGAEARKAWTELMAVDSE